MRTLLFAMLTLVTCFFAPASGRLFAQDDGIHWFDNYKQAIEEAKRTRKPIFLEFRCEA